MATVPLSSILPVQSNQSDSRSEGSRELVLNNASHEIIFAVVGHVGSGTSEIANALKDALTDQNLAGGAYDAHILKAREIILEWAAVNNEHVPEESDKTLEATERLQDLGDMMRKRRVKSGEMDLSSVARGLIKKIANLRTALDPSPSQTIAEARIVGSTGVPKPTVRRAYILDALRHPAEVHLLRRIYQEAFVLVGVVCEESKRQIRISNKYGNAGAERAKKFMDRDAKAKDKFGQRVADAFHLSDFFLDNTAERFLKGNISNPEWDVLEKLGRLVKILTHSQVIRPEAEETAMHHAHAAMMQSACLSRQVGAALIDQDGDLLATGTNEVPKAGGGVYGEPIKGPTARHAHNVESRCALRFPEANRFCSNTQEQNKIIDELIGAFTKLKPLSAEEVVSLRDDLRETRVGGLLEFSRAVHAEMDALLTAGRTGATTSGTRLFVTTFPCHYCARHIVSSGVDEVQYIEPYPKSQALELHDDSIAIEAQNWVPPSKGGTAVLFRPFSGVAPRLYRRAFLKDRELKDSHSGVYKMGAPDWGNPWYLSKISYLQLELELGKSD